VIGYSFVAIYTLHRFLVLTFRSFLFGNDTGAHPSAAAPIGRGVAATFLVTIGVTNTEVTGNSDVDDGAADH
jgi:hypothetical protein